MQLYAYFAIVKRFWPIVIGLPLVVGIISLFTALQEPQSYSASARLMLTQQPLLTSQPTLPEFDLNHSWQSSEFILDDLPQVVTSRLFAEDVSALLASQGTPIEPGVIQGGLRADNLHRTVTIQSNAATPEQAEALVRGAITVLQENGLKYWNRATPTDNGLTTALLDPVGPAGPTRGLRQVVVDVGLRTGLALGAAVGLAFLLHYLDDRVRTRQQVEEWTGMPVVGVIPKE